MKRLGDVAAVLLDLVCLSLFCFFMSFRQTDDDQIRSLSGVLAVVRQKYHWIITINGKINVWKCKLIFPSDTLHKNIKITDLKPFLAAENTSVLIIYIYIYICIYIYIYTHTVPSLSIGTV